MQVERTNSDALEVNKLPDGSTVIVDSKNETVFALNAVAGAAWDACSDPTTLAMVTENMQRTFPAVDKDLAQEAILRLHDKNLVKMSDSSSLASRRKFIATVSSIALPLVVSLSVSDQRAYAANAISAKKPCATTNPACK